MPEPKGDGNGMKGAAGILAIVAVIAGVFAMVEPMGQRIDFLEAQLSEFRTELSAARQSDSTHQRATDREIASIGEKFSEVETQFGALDARVVRFEDWLRWWQREVPSLDAIQSERIRALERDTRGQSDPLE